MLGGTAPVADGLARVAREAHQVAYRLGPGPLRRELELLAQRGRLDLAGPPPPMPADPIAALGLTDGSARCCGCSVAGTPPGRSPPS